MTKPVVGTGQQDDLFKPVHIAGLKPGEVASLMDISRVTASLWLNNRAAPHHLIRDRLDAFLEAVESALAAGDLPLSADIRQRERRDHLRKVFASHAKGDPTA